jgi:hypothetical protein
MRMKLFNTFQIVGYNVSDENQVVRKFRITADNGKDDEVSFYNLGVINVTIECVFVVLWICFGEVEFSLI